MENELHTLNTTLEQRITERTFELEQTKNRLEAIFNHSDYGIALLDVQHGIQQANVAFETLFGATGDGQGYLGAKPSMFVEADHVALIESTVQKVVAQRQGQRLEARGKRRDDTGFEIEISLAPVNRFEGDVTSLVCIIHDISERKKNEVALRESEERYHRIVELAEEGIILFDRESRITYINPKWSHLTGFSEADLIGQSYLGFVAPSFLEKTRQRFQELKRGVRGNRDVQMLKKDGSVFWVSVSSTPVFSEAGDFQGMLAMYTDINKRKQDEIALTESEERLRVLFETSPDAIVLTNLDGIVVDINPAGIGLAGLSRAQIVDHQIMTLALFIDPTHNPNLADWGSFIAADHSRRLEYQLRRPDGLIRYLETLMHPIEIAEKKMLLFVVRDITTRHEAETTLKQALAQEKELGEFKMRFVSVASHEFRTPLATIMATTETLTFYRDQMDNEKVNERLEKIKLQVGHMTHIMEDVLQLSKMQSKRVKYTPIHGNLSALCADIVEEFEVQSQNHGRIRYEAANQPVLLKYDVHLMRQIIGNLLSNALKYSSAEKHVDVSLTNDSTYIALKVRDEGIGIPEGDLKHLFEAFHRASNVGTISGTGLGLSIAEQAVDLHQGTITVESQVGIGTTFTVTIPKPVEG